MGTQGNGPVSGMGPEGVAGVSLLALGEGGSLHGASPHHGQSIWGVLMITGWLQALFLQFPDLLLGRRQCLPQREEAKVKFL